MDSYIENSGYHPQYHYFEKWLLFDTAIWFSKNTYLLVVGLEKQLFLQRNSFVRTNKYLTVLNGQQVEMSKNH